MCLKKTFFFFWHTSQFWHINKLVWKYNTKKSSFLLSRVCVCLFRVICWFWRSTADSLSVRSRPGCVTAETRTDPETPGSSVKPRKPLNSAKNNPQQTSVIDCVCVWLTFPVCFLRWRFVFYLIVFSAGLVSLVNVSISIMLGFLCSLLSIMLTFGNKCNQILRRSQEKSCHLCLTVSENLPFHLILFKQ